MKKSKEVYDIGIIGCGPRGLSALEALYLISGEHAELPKTVVFESSENIGAGPVYNLKQPNTNWLNVSERGLAIEGRKEIKLNGFIIPAFPTYQEWSGYSTKDLSNTTVDNFPLRSKMGEYLSERYKSISCILENRDLLKVIRGEVDHVVMENKIVKIEILGGASFRANEVALCIGHQPVELDNQLAEWTRRVPNIDNIELITQPYPISRILGSTVAVDKRSVGIRGFGLAMIDVVRALSEGNGGEFIIVDESTRKMKYIPSGSEPMAIVPFSLNGLPMTPKPLNKKIDDFYVPSTEQLKSYEMSVVKSLRIAENIDSTDFLIEAIAPIAADIFIALEEKNTEHCLDKGKLIKIIKSWLSDPEFSNDLILSKDLNVAKALQGFVDMATGSGQVSLDYCIGHVWRHIQPTMYRLLSFAPINNELVGEIVQLDERLKRYSYGPPVDSLQQLLALIRSGNINMDFIADPEIKLTESGWEFSSDNKVITINVMVNSVLDAPQILKVSSPLPKKLILRSEVKPIHDKLGVKTSKNALIEIDGDYSTIPIALMGRLAKGTLIGVDAIAECFGDRSKYWAEGVLNRMK